MTVMEQLTDVFRMVFDDEDICLSETTTANDIDGWDSLSHINLIVTVENTFGVRFSQGEVVSFKNVGDLSKTIERKLG